MKRKKFVKRIKDDLRQMEEAQKALAMAKLVSYDEHHLGYTDCLRDIIAELEAE